ncbi:hypothetical protein K0M31_009502 [Melipona bicolor]|uniref:Uncharacterized protein n=1 Tax=Melipona bicolor TaxID=60889 RepID=A0AA40FNU5_9HYME|nr:hypothetical protein K0M31_009502 [Melipona bicolor]
MNNRLELCPLSIYRGLVVALSYLLMIRESPVSTVGVEQTVKSLAGDLVKFSKFRVEIFKWYFEALTIFAVSLFPNRFDLDSQRLAASRHALFSGLFED